MGGIFCVNNQNSTSSGQILKAKCGQPSLVGGWVGAASPKNCTQRPAMASPLPRLWSWEPCGVTINQLQLDGTDSVSSAAEGQCHSLLTTTAPFGTFFEIHQPTMPGHERGKHHVGGGLEQPFSKAPLCGSVATPLQWFLLPVPRHPRCQAALGAPSRRREGVLRLRGEGQAGPNLSRVLLRAGGCLPLCGSPSGAPSPPSPFYWLPHSLTETSLKCRLLSSALQLPPEPTGYSFRCLTSVEHN